MDRFAKGIPGGVNQRLKVATNMRGGEMMNPEIAILAVTLTAKIIKEIASKK